MSALAERFKAHWSAQGLAVLPGVAEDRLRAFEAHYGVRLPADFRECLAAVEGPGRDEFDRDFFCFWKLDEFERACAYFQDQFLSEQCAYFSFADHSIILPAYAVRLTAEGKGDNFVLAIISERRKYSTTVVAASFTEFAERYLTDEASRIALSAGISTPRVAEKVATAITSPSTTDPSHPLWDREVDG